MKRLQNRKPALFIEGTGGNEEGQAISLHQLAMLYRMKEDYETALARSQAAEALARKADIQAHVAATLHEQGLIYNGMARAAGSEEKRGEYRANGRHPLPGQPGHQTPHRERSRRRRHPGRAGQTAAGCRANERGHRRL